MPIFRGQGTSAILHRMVPGCAGYVGRCDRFGA
jgi:hypothetical protein